jgi:hypothetical protein
LKFGAAVAADVVAVAAAAELEVAGIAVENQVVERQAIG